MNSSTAGPSGRDVPSAIRTAGALAVTEGAAGIVLAVAMVVLVGSGMLGLATVLATAGFFALLAAGVVVVGVGLLRGRRWARAPAIVVQVLLLPVAYTLLSGGQRGALGVLAGLATGAVVIVSLVLLLSRAAKAWAAALDAHWRPDDGGDQAPHRGE